MMNNFNSFGTLSIWHYSHMLFCLLFLVGLVLLIVWLAKNLKKEDLRKTVIWLLALGALGALVTAPLGMWGSGASVRGWGGHGYMMGGFSGNQMFECIQDEECHEEMEDLMHNMMGI